MKTLMILNDAPYGSEPEPGQKVPSGYYNTQNMLGAVLRHGGTVGVCGSCIDARGITDGELAEGARRSSLDELTAWTLEADRVLTF